MGSLKLTEGEPATWEDELEKEIPNKVTLSILQKVWPNMRITAQHDKHVSGADYLIGNKNILYIDSKNDTKLGLTGNICLDKVTTNKQGVIQLFMNYPRFPKNYLFVYNDLLPPKKTLEEWVIRRKQDYGGYTEAYVVPVAKLKHRIYEVIPKLAHPSLKWFTRKREIE